MGETMGGLRSDKVCGGITVVAVCVNDFMRPGLKLQRAAPLLRAAKFDQ